MTEPPPLTPDELYAIAGRERTRHSWTRVGTAVTVAAALTLVIVAVLLLGSQNQQKALSDRSDCKTQYQSILGGPVTIRDDLTSQVAAIIGHLDGELGSALISAESGRPPTLAVVSAFTATADQLAAKTTALNSAIAVVEHLPALNEATVNGFTFAGRHYPACPTAS